MTAAQKEQFKEIKYSPYLRFRQNDYLIVLIYPKLFATRKKTKQRLNKSM